MHIEIQQEFSKTSPIHQKSLTPLSAIMKFRIPILTNVLNIYTPQPQKRIIKNTTSRCRLGVNPCCHGSSRTLECRNHQTKTIEAQTSVGWWFLLQKSSNFQKKTSTHTNLLVPFRLCWPRTYQIIFFETKDTAWFGNPFQPSNLDL